MLQLLARQRWCGHDRQRVIIFVPPHSRQTIYYVAPPDDVRTKATLGSCSLGHFRRYVKHHRMVADAELVAPERIDGWLQQTSLHNYTLELVQERLGQPSV